MKQKLINQFSGWWRDLPMNPESYYLVMTDDMDSYYSCKMLNKMFGVEIGGFYKFGVGLYLTDKARKSEKEPIYIDCSVAQDGVYCFDNHMNIRTNHNMINPNLVIDRYDSNCYSKKYCGSTLLFLIGLYEKQCSELEKLYALAVDGFYIGWYRANGRFRDVNKFWLEQFELESFADLLDKHDNKFFSNFICEKQLDEKIIVANGQLLTFADILPHDKFKLVMPTQSFNLTRDHVDRIRQTDKRLFTCAETHKGYYCADILKQGA